MTPRRPITTAELAMNREALLLVAELARQYAKKWKADTTHPVGQMKELVQQCAVVERWCEAVARSWARAVAGR